MNFGQKKYEKLKSVQQLVEGLLKYDYLIGSKTMKRVDGFIKHQYVLNYGKDNNYRYKKSSIMQIIRYVLLDQNIVHQMCPKESFKRQFSNFITINGVVYRIGLKTLNNCSFCLTIYQFPDKGVQELEK